MSHNALFSYPEPNPDELRKTHEEQRIEGSHDASLSFTLRKPLAMSVAMPSAFAPTSRGVPEPLAAFGLKPSLQGPRLGVSCHALEWEVDPLEWLRWLCAKSGWKVALATAHSSPGGPRYEIAALRDMGGKVVVRRTIAVRSGTRLVRCDASATLPLWSVWHDALWFALDSFRLGRPGRGTVEELVVRGGHLLGFAMPGSWDARGDGGANGMLWALQPIRDVQRGAALQIRAFPQDKARPADERRSIMLNDISNAGARLGAALQAERADFASLVPGWVGQWQAAAQTEEGDGVVVLAQRECDGVALDYLLTAPAAGTDHVDWMRATRALDLVIATSQLRPPAAAPGRS
jgi:hypothetical protein